MQSALQRDMTRNTPAAILDKMHGCNMHVIAKTRVRLTSIKLTEGGQLPGGSRYNLPRATSDHATFLTPPKLS